MAKAQSFATFLIIGPTCFFLGILFCIFPYDYHVLWSAPPSSSPYPDDHYLTLLENHLKFLASSPPLISRILHIVIGTGLLGFITKLYKPSEANLLFDGASLVLYMCGVVVYIANIVKGLRVVMEGTYGAPPEGRQEGADAPVGTFSTLSGEEGDYIGREDSLKVLAASNTILALVLVGVLVLQAGQWYAQRKEEAEIAEMDRVREEKHRSEREKGDVSEKGRKKKQ
ncbi:secretory component protein shr3 [Viridothelium virens]|uniref:Secretory component protein shr3 n=1 Tax=Viridothelium virens TaxID=1048519 RepID=A0A6A6HMM1_VIRVR|nr:secretory component protein shr3 [Viridothelium virens]